MSMSSIHVFDGGVIPDSESSGGSSGNANIKNLIMRDFDLNLGGETVSSKILCDYDSPQQSVPYYAPVSVEDMAQWTKDGFNIQVRLESQPSVAANLGFLARVSITHTSTEDEVTDAKVITYERLDDHQIKFNILNFGKVTDEVTSIDYLKLSGMDEFTLDSSIDITIDDIIAKIPDTASSSNKLVTEQQLENATASMASGYTPKGPASVSTLNGLTGQENGYQYIVTDSGTLTYGSLAVTAGESVAWDSANNVWYKVNQYALNSVLNNVVHSIAPEFDPARTSENPYKVNDVVIRNGKLYVFVIEHYGAWSDIHAKETSIDKINIESCTVAVHDNNASNLDDLNNAPHNSFLILSVTSNTTTQNLPSDFGTGMGFLQTIKGYYVANERYLLIQLIRKNDGTQWTRIYNSYDDTWTNWSKKHYAEKTDIANMVSMYPKQIFDNWSQNISDLDDAPDNAVIMLTVTANTTTSNLPPNFSGSGMLFTSFAEFSNGWSRCQYIYKNATGCIWSRSRNKSGSTTYSWSAWSETTNLRVVPNQIYTTWNQNVADLNDVAENSITVINTSSATQTLNIPPEFKTGATYNGGHLVTMKAFYNASSYQVFQILIRWRDGKVWMRTKTGTWGEWHVRFGDGRTIEIGEGKDFTTLRAGINAAYNMENARVIIYPGTYDLVDEFSDVLSNTLTSVQTPCPLGKGMTVTAMDGVQIKALFERPEGMTDAHFASIRRYFEPFGFRNGSYTLENLNIESKNCRYCVHDDQGTGPYVHKYINCRMTRYVEDISVGDTFFQCIGGGLQKNGTIVISGGAYKVVTAIGIPNIENGDPDFAQSPIAYHNSFLDDAESSIELHDVFFADRGYLMLTNYGPTMKVTKAYVSGCRFGLPILLKDGGNSPHQNMAVAAEWNNLQAIPGNWSVNGAVATWIPAT